MELDDLNLWTSKMDSVTAKRWLKTTERIGQTIAQGYNQLLTIPADFKKMATDQKTAAFLRHGLGGFFSRIEGVVDLVSYALRLRLKDIEREKK